MEPRIGGKILWIIVAVGILATLVSWPSRAQVPQVLPSRNLDKQSKKTCDKYNAAFVEIVSSNWWNLIDSKATNFDRGQGKVILNFTLHSNGQVTDMKIAKTGVSVDDTSLCQKAVLIGVPYQSWSGEILKALKTNCCVVTFTFYYRAAE